MRLIRRTVCLSSKVISLAGLCCPVSAIAAAGEPWTLEDIVAAPEVTDIKLAASNDYALYIVRSGDLSRDENRSELRRINLADGSQSTLLNSSTLKRLQAIPRTADWSALIDLGEGQQLYRIRADGKIDPLISNAKTVLVGNADQAVYSFDGLAPVAVGVVSYDWSPDGKRLWYTQLRRDTDKEPVLFDDAVTSQRDQKRSPTTAIVDFYIRDADGKDRLVTSRSTKDFFAFRYGGRVKWAADRVTYRTATPNGKSGYSFQSYSWSFKDGVVSKDSEQTKSDAISAVWGVNGGSLATEGIGWKKHLVETLDDGRRFDFGEQSYTVGDPRSAGSFLSRDAKRAIVGTRDLQTGSYGLALVGKDESKQISGSGSVTRCDFNGELTYGLCIRQGLTVPPEIVAIRPERNSVTLLAPISARHGRLAKLNASRRIWINRLGYKAAGYVVLPENYDRKKSYPAIFVTHGSDADERFAASDMQWNYPVQMLVQAGYVVVLINDPYPLQDAKLAAVYNQLVNRVGDIPPSEIQKMDWLSPVYSIEDAAYELAKEGLVDLKHVGIAGYSRGSQIVNVALTQSKLFKAGSSGDGSHLEPFTYPISPASFDVIFGGPPLGENFKNYQALSPSLRASRSCGALLSQMAATFPGAIDFHSAMRAAGVPAQISLYPGETEASDETHIFHIPSNRIEAMKENLAWFDFWLRDRQSDLVSPWRIKQWEEMRDGWKNPCQSGGSNSR